MNIACSIRWPGARSVAALLLALSLAIPARGQDVFSALTMGRRDVAEIRKKAETGDAAAQVDFGDVLVSHLRPADALSWYRKAAAQSNVLGEFNVGKMLLFGAGGYPADQAVHADPVHGLRWTFMAATNHNFYAYQNMSRALREGIGTSIDLVAAYAWLQVYFDTARAANSLASK